MHIICYATCIFPQIDPKVPLVPPRFLERFSNKKVKQGASITLSVKVEGMACYHNKLN